MSGGLTSTGGDIGSGGESPATGGDVSGGDAMAGGEMLSGGDMVTGGTGMTGGTGAIETGCGKNLLPIPDDPGLRGPWKVGIRTVKIGRLDVDVLYPAEPGSTDGLPVATFNLRDWLPEEEQSKVADKDTPDVTALDGDIYRDVPVDAGHGPYPAVIMIHGTSSMRIASGSVMAHWASRGFVVLGADYPGLLLADKLAEVPICPFPQSGAQDIPGDVKLQMDAIKSSTGPLEFLSGSIDFEHAAIAGHSQGACVAATLTTMFDNVESIIAMSGSTNVSAAPNLKSLMYISGIDDTVIGYDMGLIGNVVCPGNPGPAISSANGYETSPDVRKRLVGITGGGHLVPTDLCQTNDAGRNAIEQAKLDGVCGIDNAVFIGLPALFDCGTIDREAGLRAVNYATTAQLEETLHCVDRTAAFAEMQMKLPQIGDFRESL